MRIVAKLRTRCECGYWVVPGETIEWDPETRRTSGCRVCNWAQHAPDDDRDQPDIVDAYEAFHDW